MRKDLSTIESEVVYHYLNVSKHSGVTAKFFGICQQSVCNILARNGHKLRRPITDAEQKLLLSDYQLYVSSGRLQELAKKLGRTKAFICRKAKKLGLTDMKRDKVALSKDKRMEVTLKTFKTRIDRYGALTNTGGVNSTSWKCGYRTIGGVRYYLRSSWEANYARFLQKRKDAGCISDWSYESVTFLLKTPERITAYIPDFVVTGLDGSIQYHEVKGWMDDRSIEKLKLMAELYPKESITIIDKAWFSHRKHLLPSLIEGWEGK